MIELLRKKLDSASMVLVGIGEALETEEQHEEKALSNWTEPFMRKLYLDEMKKKKIEIYGQLAGLLKDKNYFIVSVCLDDAVLESGLRKDRIVKPCGGYKKLQCAQKCRAELFEVSSKLMEQMRDFREGKITEKELERPLCPNCGSPLEFNNILTENYAEEGYLEQWQQYTKWLQGTVNREICILELGAGMRYPTVIRWPFEKITYFNQKATFFRVHNRLYQTAEEIKERSYGICAEPEEFLKQLSKVY